MDNIGIPAPICHSMTDHLKLLLAIVEHEKFVKFGTFLQNIHKLCFVKFGLCDNKT